MQRSRKDVVERFWVNVDKRGEDDCWEWKTAVTGSGYGRFGIVHGKTVPAHRYSWSLVNGEIPIGMIICHKCDNPACVNPNHLFLGTTQDNVDDREAKQRGARGEKHPLSKLTDADVLDIINKHSSENISHRKLAGEYEVSRSLIFRILKGKSWKHVSAAR